MMRNFTFSLLLHVLLCVTPAAAQPLTDPGPAWAGISDTASFRVTVERHLADAERAIAEVKAVRGARTVANTVILRKTAEHHLDAAAMLGRIALDAHPDAEFRDVAQAWEGRVAERSAAFAVDRELYDALAAVDLAGADAGTRYIVERDLASYRRNGVDRDEATRDQVAALRARLTDLGTRFERNIFTDVRSLRLHPDALAGVPDDLFAAQSPDDDGLLAIELTPANIGPLLTYAERDIVRAAAFQAMYSAGSPQNIIVVDSLRALRHELASLLGFSSWAAYAMEPMMAGSPERVRSFIAEIDEASAEATRREVSALLAVQRSEEPAAEAVDVWSYQHWQHRLRQQAYGFDEQAMREYLPYNRVRDGILATFEQLFGLTFRRAHDAPVWSDAVEPYEVWEDGALVGRIYLDMHPREGKFRHFAAFPLRLGGGTLPEMALVCNFPGGGKDDPGLLSPGDLRTFFHEFGHLIDFLMAGRAPLVGSFEWDFVEAPSQLLEEWAGDTIVLSHFARHYETGEPIPTELVASYRRAEAFGRALGARINLWLAALALDLHTDLPGADPTAVTEERVTAAYLPFDRPAWLRPAASVPHIAAYSSNYYTYLWSEVIARDLLTAFDRDNLLDPEAGRRYRDLVLAPTGTAPSGVLVERFLGRPFNADAWRLWLEGEARGPADTTSTDASPQAGRDSTVHVAPPTGESATDRASILAALEQVRSGGTVQFAPGMYLVGEIIPILTPRVTLLGHTEGTTLRGCDPAAYEEMEWAAAAAGDDWRAQFAAVRRCGMFELMGGHAIVRGFTFDYTRMGLMLGCCHAEREHRPTEGGYLIEHNTFRNSGNGIRPGLLSAEPTVIRGNRFINTFHAVSAMGGHLHILENDISVPEPGWVPAVGHPSFAISFCGDHNLVAGNRIEGHPDGIEIYAWGAGCRHNVIRDNTIEVRRVPIPRPRPYPDLPRVTDAADSTIVGVPLLLINQSGEVPLEDNLIEGNRIVGAEGIALELSGGTRNRIVNNTFSAIRVRDPFPGNGLGPPPTWETANGSAIWVSSGSDHNEIRGNTFEEIAAYAVVLEGDSNTVETRSDTDTVRDLGSGNRVSGFAAAEWVDPSPQTVRLVNVAPDVRIEVLDWGGTGEPLVLLAGMMATAHTFDDCAPRLTDAFRVLAVTRRGFRFEPAGNGLRYHDHCQ